MALESDGEMAAFKQATEWARSPAASRLSTEVQLSLYGYYKQATVGDCSGTQPWGMEASMKWKAWHSQAGLTPGEAMKRYVTVLDYAAPGWRQGGEAPEDPDSGGVGLGPAVSRMGAINDPDKPADADETPVGRLCDQVSKGEIDAVRKALQTNPELAFQKDKDGMTPLHWAADSGDEEVVLMLLAMLGEGPEAFKKVNIRDDNGDTPLHYAVLTERRSVAELLAARGADLYAENDDGETPCALAIAQGWGGIFAAATH